VIEGRVVDLPGLEAMLAELRQLRTDHQAVEAKRAARALPETTHETLSAFANTEGGWLLLGVDEGDGSFAVTGVEDVKQLQSDLQAQCALMDPPLRATVDLVEHPDGTVLAAYVPPVPRDQRPCHRAHDGAEAASFIRVGDGDQRMTATEVSQMMANRRAVDYSAAPAPQDAVLDGQLVEAFARTLRAANARYTDVADSQLLRQFGVVNGDGHPTYAGVLMLGETPQRWCAAARVTYRRLPRRGDPTGTRFAGKHLEGTVGELLEDTLAALEADLDVVQVVRGGTVFDELDVPREALREVLSNAFVHRSLATGQSDASVLVEVTDEAVLVTSPGGLHVSADPATLGLAPIAGVRNLTLVRIGEHARTPAGGRIVEHQMSGIVAADKACRVAGTMPVLFVDRPATFQAVLLRGAVDAAPAEAALQEAGLSGSADQVRLLAVLSRLDFIREHVAVSGLESVAFDARLAARALAERSVEDAAAELRLLEDAGVLRRSRIRRLPVWVRDLTRSVQPAAASSTPPPASSDPKEASSKPAPTKGGRSEAGKRRAGRPRGNRVPELLAAVAAAPGGVLGAKGIGQALGLSSPDGRNRWIREALEKNVIESTSENMFDPTGGYRLTRAGRALLQNHPPAAVTNPPQ
jgi:ATP-dependent DNA helicase RecG